MPTTCFEYRDTVNSEVVVRGQVRGSRYLAELVRCRDVLLFLALRDILVRYRRAAFGFAWAIARPLLLLAVLASVFGFLTGSPPKQSFPLVLAVAPAWIFVSAAASDSISCLTRNAALISKAPFPRALLVLSSLAVNVVDLVVAMLLTVGLLSLSGIALSLKLLLLPMVCLWLFLLTLGVALWIAALNARYRDLVNVVPFVLHLLLVISPVGYSIKSIPEPSRLWFALNPLTGVFEAFRFCLIGQPVPDATIILGSSLVLSIILLVSGFVTFTRYESWINDYL